MPSGTRTCKICGCEYEYCKTHRSQNIFRWQDVACSPEHGQEYLERVIASRSKTGAATVASETSKPKKIRKKAQKVIEEDNNEELSKEDFDDNTEEPVIETK